MRRLAVSYVKELIRQIDEDDALGLAAQCAYYFLFSLFPFALFVMSLFGYLPVSTENIMGMVANYLPLEVLRELEGHLVNLLDVKRGGTLSLGLIFSLITASAAMNAIVLSVNKAYGLPKRKSFIHSRLLAMVLTIGMLVVIGSALLLTVFGHVIMEWLQANTDIAWHKLEQWNGLRWIISSIILFIVFVGIYYFAPNTCLSCKDVLPGAIVATAGWQLASLGFSYYVSHWGNYSATYGSLGGVIVLLTWFYISALLIIIGGEINALHYLNKSKPSGRL